MRHLVFLLLLCMFHGCSDGGVVGEQTITLKAVGLWLTANPLSAPEGALSRAANAAIRRPGVVEPRRGQKPDATGPTGEQIDALASFEGGLVLHTGAGKLARRVDDTTTSTYTGTFDSPDGYPTRFADIGGALYATTDEGLVRLDALAGQWVSAGVPPGLEGSGVTTGASGWLANNGVVGYRLVWGARDGDGALLLGAPSGRFLVTNSSGGTRDVSLTTPIPNGVVAGTHFLQVYRTVLTTTGGDPGEDMAQVAEVFPSAPQIATGSMTVTDIASFASGPTAYFSPSIGPGVSDAHLTPPLGSDIVPFRGYSFVAVSEYEQSVSLTLIAVGGTDGLQLGDGIRVISEDGMINEGVVANATEVPGSGLFELVTGGTAAENIEGTARSLVRVLNVGGGLSSVYAQYVSGNEDLPGMIAISSRAVGGSRLRLESQGRDIGEPSPWVPALVQPFAGDVTRVANVSTITVVSTSGLTVGDVVRAYIGSTDPSFPEITTTIASIPTGTTFTIADSGPNDSALALTFAFTQVEDVDFGQDATPGSWAHSAFEEPDAWPPRFRFQVGGPSTRLDRIVAQGEALIFFTSDGLYRLTGDDEDNFNLRPLDPTVRAVGAKTVVTVGNRAMALTDQGVVSVSDLGVEKVSTPLDEELLQFYAGSESLKEQTEAVAFAVAYESENEYVLFLPDPFGDPGDLPDRAYVYNLQTRAWSGPWTWTWEGINEGSGWVTTGIVNVADGRFYVASGDRLTRERKDRALSDYQDSDGAGIPVDVAYQVQTARNPGALKQWIEAAIMLEAPQPASADLYFTTESSPDEDGGTLTSKGNKFLRTFIPRNKSRSARLTVGFRHDTPLEKPVLLGLSVVFNTTSTRVGR